MNKLKEFFGNIFSTRKNKIIITIIIAILVVCFVVFVLFFRKPPYEDLTKMYNDGEYKSLISKLEYYYDNNPKDEKIAILLSRSYVLFGLSVDRVDEYADKALTIINSQPISLNILKTKGYIYATLKNYDLAQEAYRQALKIDKNDAELIADLASTYEAQRNIGEAYLFFKKAYTLDPGNYKAGLGYFRMKAIYGEYDYIIDRVTVQVKHINDKKYLAGLYEILGSAYANKRDFDNAKKMFRNALNLDENRIVSLVGLADSLVKTIYKLLGNQGETIEGLTVLPEELIGKAVKLDPDYIYSYLVLLDIERLRQNSVRQKQIELRIETLLKDQKFLFSERKIIEDKLLPVVPAKIKINYNK